MGRDIQTYEPFKVYDLSESEISEDEYNFWSVKRVRNLYGKYFHHEISYIDNRRIDEEYCYASRESIEELNSLIESIENKRTENEEELPNFGYTIINDDDCYLSIIRYTNTDEYNKDKGYRIYTIEILNTSNQNTERYEYYFDKSNRTVKVNNGSSKVLIILEKELISTLNIFINNYSQVHYQRFGKDKYSITWTESPIINNLFILEKEIHHKDLNTVDFSNDGIIINRGDKIEIYGTPNNFLNFGLPQGN